jgi:IclR family pca regulon transcriptional regulator
MPRSNAHVGVGGWVLTVRDPRHSQSLERGLAILTCFTNERPVLGIKDIAGLLGMSTSTTHRYVITLVALGYLEQGVDRRYRLGLRVTDLGLSALNSLGLRDHARGPLEELRRRSSYTVNLAVLDGPRILYVERARSFRPGQHLIDLGLHLGSRLPAYCTAMGKVLLAYLPDEELEGEIRAMTLAPRAPNTITGKHALCNELERIREAEGFAVNDQELTEGLYSVAVPVRCGETVVGAINMAAHTSMVSLRLLVETDGPQLVETANVISARLGDAREGQLSNGNGRHG